MNLEEETLDKPIKECAFHLVNVFFSLRSIAEQCIFKCKDSSQNPLLLTVAIVRTDGARFTQYPIGDIGKRFYL